MAQTRRFNWSSLLGYDVFISYRQNPDSVLYARNLRNALSNEGYTCFLDQEETWGGVELTPALARALKRSRLLVVIAESSVSQSRWVSLEVEHFRAKRSSTVLPISIGGFLEGNGALDGPLGYLREVTWVGEPKDAYARGTPSAETIEAINQSFRRTRVRSWSRAIIGAVLLVISAVALVAVGQWRDAVEQRDAADEARTNERTQRGIAEKRSEEAGKARDEAEEARKAEKTERLNAQEQQRVAERERDEADRQRKLAEKRRREALGHGLAARAALMIKEEPHLLPRALLLAAESLRLVPSAEAQRALRDGLALLPRKTAQLNHGDVVHSVAPHPHLPFIATASGDGTARVWEIPSGNEVLRIGHGGDVVEVAFKPPEGDYLATASRDGTVRIWDMAAETEYKTINVGGWVEALIYSDDGRYLAAGGGNGRVLVFDAKANEVFELEGHESVVLALAFSPSSLYLATASQDDTARVWNLDERRAVRILKHGSLVKDVTFGATDEHILTASYDRTAKIWSWPSGAVVSSVVHDAAIGAAAFAPGGEIVATGSSDGEILVWSALNGSLLSRMTHAEGINSLSFGTAGDELLSTSDDGTARVWSVSEGSEILVMNHDAAVMDVSYLPGGQFLVSGGFDRSATVWTIKEFADSVLELSSLGQAVSIDFSSDDELIAMATLEREVSLWVVSDGTQYANLQHEEPVNRVLFSPRERKIATVTGVFEEAVVTVWDLDTRGKILEIMVDGKVESVSFSSTGDHLAVGSSEGVAIWHVDTKEEVKKMDLRGVTDVQFLPDSTLLGTAHSSGNVSIWNWESEVKLKEFRADFWVNDIGFSPDGELLSASSGGVGYENWVHVWEIDSGLEIKRLHHSNTPQSVEFSSSGKYLAAAGWDRTARVWETASWRQIASFEHDDSIVSVAFSADEALLATAGWDRISKVWRLGPDDLVRTVHQVVGRQLTRAEWAEYLPGEDYPSFSTSTRAR